MPILPRMILRVALLLLAGACWHSAHCFAESSPDSDGWARDFATAEKEAQRLGRPLLIHFSADWCVPCRRMERDVLKSRELAAQLKQSFVAVKVDADAHPEILKRFGVRSLPADLVVSTDGKVLIETRGYQEKRSYVGRLAQLGSRLRPLPNTPLEPIAPQKSQSESFVTQKQQNQEPPPFPQTTVAGMEGYSPVSLFNWREWRKGQAEFTAYHQGVAYQLASKEELEQFNTNPEKYVPRLLGCDPVILQQSDRAVQGSTKFGAYFDGSLFLFQSQETRTEFKKAPMRYVKTRHVLKADQIEKAEIRQSTKPADPTEPVRQ